MNATQLSELFSTLSESGEHIAGLRRLVVALAISGRLGQTEGLIGTPQSKQPSQGWSTHQHDSAALHGRSGKPVTQEELPEGFPYASAFMRLGDVAKIEKGKTGIKQAQQGPYKLVVTGAGRLSCDHFDFDTEAAIVPLVSSTGHGNASLNRLHFESGKFALGTILAAAIPLNPTLMSARFLFEYLSAFKDELLVPRMTGTANVTLTIGKLAEVPVPLVPRETQLKVDELMALLDRLEAARSAREATRDRLTTASLTRLIAPEAHLEAHRTHGRFVLDNIPALFTRADQIKQLRQTILNLAVKGKLVPQLDSEMTASTLLSDLDAMKEEMRVRTRDSRIKIAKAPISSSLPFELPKSWAWQSFENLFLFIDYRGQTPTKTTDGIPLITAKNVRMGFMKRDPAEFVSKQTYDRWMTRGFPKVGDLFFTTEAPLANVCVNEIVEPFALAQRVVCLQPYGTLNTRFFAFAIMSEQIQRLIEEHSTGLTAKGIKMAKLKPLPLPVPPLAEQHRIVAKVDELMVLCDRLEAALQSADTTRSRLLDALLHEALASETTECEAA